MHNNALTSFTLSSTLIISSYNQDSDAREYSFIICSFLLRKFQCKNDAHKNVSFTPSSTQYIEAYKTKALLTS